jgi:predicted PurR-regulated permease PerM
MARTSAALARRSFYLLGSAGLVVAALYWGQKILIPLALAMLLSFVLAPLVSRLERRGLGRRPAVLLVVALAFGLLGLAGWSIASQVSALINDLPAHKNDVRAKIAALQGNGKRGLLGRVQDFLDEVEKASQPHSSSDVPLVRVRPERPSVFAQVQAVLGQFLGVLSAGLVVVLLVMALLIHREDLRNRIIRLAGRGHLSLTTRALDEVGQRIGGYLLGHSVVNAGFGVGVGLGLLALGQPYPALWGFLAGSLRFVPGMGVWLVAPFPAALAFIRSPGPAEALEVLALFLALELLTAQQVEWRVCSPSVGLSSVPLLLAVLFWTGLWGIVGLVLATPLTVCLAVLGKHVPQMEFLAVLLGSRPALTPEARLFQRLLARDRFEAEAVVREHLAERTLESLCDEVVVPALVLMRHTRHHGELEPEDEQFVLQATAELVEGLAGGKPPAGPSAEGAGQVLILPARDAIDEAAARVLGHLALAAGHDVLLTGEASPLPGRACVLEKPPAAAMIVSVAPEGLTQARYLCRRLRGQFDELRIVVARLGQRRELRKSCKHLLAAGANRVVTTLREACGQLEHIVPTASGLEDGAPSLRG